ncbi:MAG TPA: DUF2505 family protein [Acidimicrobiales bacterium]|nr:DUF2505 family protein [Acidimicrobiales bacterium]
MKLIIDQAIEVTPDQAQAALLDAAFYESLGQLEGISAPEVRSLSSENGRAHAVLGYRFAGELNGVARSVLDPAKLTWAQLTDVDLPARRTEIRMVPDNYAGLLSFAGWYELRPGEGGGTCQHLEAELRVNVPLLGALAERAIAGSIGENLAATAALVERFVAGQRASAAGSRQRAKRAPPAKAGEADGGSG